MPCGSRGASGGESDHDHRMEAMSAWFWLGRWTILLAGSIVAHEIGHVVAGLRCGWSYGGTFVRLRVSGVGVHLDPPTPEAEKRLWLVALAGPLASAMLAAIFWPLSVLPGQSGLVFTSLWMLNMVFVVANLIPSPITDGGFVVQSIFGVRVSWRRFALIVSALWLISEVIAAYFLL